MSDKASDLVDPKLQKAIYMVTELAHTIMKLPTEDIGLMVNLTKQCIKDACITHSKCSAMSEELTETHGGWENIPDEEHHKLYELVRSEVQDFLTAAACMALAAAWNPTIDAVSLDPKVLGRMDELTEAMRSVLESSDENETVEGLIKKFIEHVDETEEEDSET